MKKPILISTLSALVLGAGLAAADTGEDPKVAEAKVIVKEFFSRLTGELQSALQAGGPVTAIAICQQRAPAIAAELSAGSDWQVGRTSLKNRNPNNAPDGWETTVLERFDERAAAGEDIGPMAYTEVVETDEGRQFRFMKAIPTQEICLTCHGREIQPDVVEALDAAYPTDKARGYTVGEVRGAFTLSKPL